MEQDARKLFKLKKFRINMKKERIKRKWTNIDKRDNRKIAYGVLGIAVGVFLIVVILSVVNSGKQDISDLSGELEQKNLARITASL